MDVSARIFLPSTMSTYRLQFAWVVFWDLCCNNSFVVTYSDATNGKLDAEVGTF